MYVWPVPGGDQGLLRVLEGKLARMTQRVLSIWIEQILAVMQEFVVGITPIWIRLMRRVARVVLVYIEAEEAATDEEADDDDDASDAGDHA